MWHGKFSLDMANTRVFCKLRQNGNQSVKYDVPSKLTQDLGLSRALTLRYVVALLLVATLSTAAWLSLDLVIAEQKSTSAIVNVSGRQRMLSQRTALFSSLLEDCLLYTSPSPRDRTRSRMPSSA